ncbi:MAG: MerR family transcriptional regulator [Proteobacteria bacterium]|nr:MerR family transcriptional regulator [Pseudomonadota bacterium]
MDNKAPDAFRTISEVADELDLPQHVLRFWESRFSEIKPMKRGGGRRFYRPDDIDLLRGIRHLLYGEGYTIRGVQRILREQGIEFVQTIWQEGAAPAPSDEDVEDVEEAFEDEEEAEEEPRGLRDRIASLIGRDLNEPGDDSERQEPPMQSAPMPRIDPGERIFAPAVADRPAVSEPAPRAEPPREPQMRPAVSNALPAEKLERLKAVLDELKECRSLIDAALTPAAK